MLVVCGEFIHQQACNHYIDKNRYLRYRVGLRTGKEDAINSVVFIVIYFFYAFASSLANTPDKKCQQINNLKAVGSEPCSRETFYSRRPMSLTFLLLRFILTTDVILDLTFLIPRLLSLDRHQLH